jgi:hypothetical protein
MQGWESEVVCRATGNGKEQSLNPMLWDRPY